MPILEPTKTMKRTENESLFYEFSCNNSEPWTIDLQDVFGGRSGRDSSTSLSVNLLSFRYRPPTTVSGRFSPRLCLGVYGISYKTYRIVKGVGTIPHGVGTPALVGCTSRTVDTTSAATDAIGSVTFDISADTSGELPTAISVWVEDGSVDAQVLTSPLQDTSIPPVPEAVPTPASIDLWRRVDSALSKSPPSGGASEEFNAIPCRINLPITRTTVVGGPPFFNTDISRKIDLWFIGVEATTGGGFPDNITPYNNLSSGGDAYVAFYGGAGMSTISDLHQKGAAFATFVHLTTEDGNPAPNLRIGTVRFDYIVGDEVDPTDTHVFPPGFVAKRSIFTIKKIYVLPRTDTFDITFPIPPLTLAQNHPESTPIGEGLLIPLNISSYSTLTGTLQVITSN